MSMKMAKRVSLSRPWGLNRSPHENRAVVPLHWVLIRVTGRSGPTDRTLLLSFWSPDGSHVSPAFNSERLISTVDKLTGRSNRTDRTLNPQRPVVYSKGPKPVFANRTHPVMLDRTQPSVRCLTLTTVLTDLSARRGLSASGRRATQRPVS